ncbi:hypothetical protein DERP_001702 [Dermatophagoides pteronyssinus]|uniref:Uncharacterized protein n=1 Tax=Dermatophagoides pteronyssinus TaxID=6956 RepID=A0ABQ8JB93_DERPT|nr:hypothetical protein DERP_001702 [Dermatophagoides pteronyssinus]
MIQAIHKAVMNIEKYFEGQRYRPFLNDNDMVDEIVYDPYQINDFKGNQSNFNLLINRNNS